MKSSIGLLRTDTGELTNEWRVKAELLQRTFSSFNVVDNGIVPQLPNCLTPRCSAALDSVIFSPALVSRAIKRMKAKAKGGPDGVPPLFLKKCSAPLCIPLSIMFQLSLESGLLPADWLKAHIIPIFKKADRCNSVNYLPISLTCSLCKIMESIIKDQMLSYLLSNSIITKCQHAFISKHSTAINLLETVKDWSVQLNSSKCIDFSRAFDSISFF